jgi:hypothetical protein
MLRVFHLDVAKVDLVLHMLHGTHLPSCMRVRSGGGWRQGHGLSPLLRVEPDSFQAGWELRVELDNFTNWVGAASGRLLELDVRALASPLKYSTI